jgi:beta-galactosidase
MNFELPAELFYGGDYNPEQWDREIWLEDMRLMRAAGVNLVTLGVFSWTNIETSEGHYDFGWLDEIFELLHQNGIGVDLATATASPPAWLAKAHPEMLPVNAAGTRLSHGGRQGYCVSSPIYKRKAQELASELAKRYGAHPALRMWHINNEYGCHNPLCFCDVSGEAWRQWLQSRYDNLEDLNYAWGTNFWSQRYHQWDEINPPRQTPDGTFPNPTMMLDYRRFSSDQILDLYLAEKAAIREIDSVHPITTNFMSMKHSMSIDYWRWASEVDFVATDHYLIAEDAENYIDLAFQADLTRGFAGGKPWLLMEHSTSAVNWQERNIAKADGEMLANSLSHVARGSNGAMFFQWRASVSGSEKFHSAMVPHAGEDTRIHRNVKQLGAELQKFADVANHPTEKAQVVMLFDYQSWWALAQRNLPTTSIDYPQLAHDWYRALWKLGVRVDFVSPDVSPLVLADYRAVLMPMTYLLSDEQERKFIEYKNQGGALVASYFTGISNLDDRVKLQGYGGLLVREGLGVQVEEFAPVRQNDFVQLSNGATGVEWAEFAHVTKAVQVATYIDGVSAGSVAIAKHDKSWYLGSRIDHQSLSKIFIELVGDLGLVRRGGGNVEVVRRGLIEFEINHESKSFSWKTFSE